MTENRYIRIVETPSNGKTKKFNIINKSSNCPIGKIEWYWEWRQYCFFPSNYSIFNSTCIALITDFLKDINTKHRKK